MWQTGPPVDSTPLLISPMKYHTLYGKELFKISDHLLIFESIECKKKRKYRMFHSNIYQN